MPITLLSLVALLAYLAATALLARPLFGQGPGQRRPARIAAILALITHAVVLFGAHRGVLDLHFFAALSLVAWVVALLTVVVDAWRPIAALGVIVFPLTALLLALDAFVAAPTLPQPLDWPIQLHATVALVAFSLLAIAAAIALLLAFQDRALRTHRPGGWLSALPPLTLTEALLFRLIGAGFVFLTLTLVTGVVFVDDLFGQHLAHKTVLSMAAWLIFGLLLFGRWRYGWRGRRAVNLTLVGMAVLMLAFFGTKFVLELLLGRAV